MGNWCSRQQESNQSIEQQHAPLNIRKIKTKTTRTAPNTGNVTVETTVRNHLPSARYMPWRLDSGFIGIVYHGESKTLGIYRYSRKFDINPTRISTMENINGNDSVKATLNNKVNEIINKAKFPVKRRSSLDSASTVTSVVTDEY